MESIRPIPNSPQEFFLSADVREVGFGGQAGGAKSFSLILDALGQIHMKGYNAILFRRTYKQLSGADGLIELSRQVYPLLGGTYLKGEYLWTFKYQPGTIRFAHLEHESSVYNYQGHQYPYIGFDELQNFTERQYVFLFSRNRASNPDIKPYTRATFNPGDIGHYWIKKRFIDTDITMQIKHYRRINGVDTHVRSNDPLSIGRMFIPSSVEQNPYLWQGGTGDYVAALEQLDPVDYARLRKGDWHIRREGRVYHQFSDANIIPYDNIPFSSKDVYYHAHDFGAVNRAWGLIVKCSDGKYYLIHEDYLEEGTSQSRAASIKTHLHGKKVIAGYGGAKSEKQQRTDYSSFGVSIRTPKETDVESQIDIVNTMFEDRELYIASNCGMTIDQLENCVRDDKEGIAEKNKWHNLDVLRYFGGGVGKRKKKAKYGFAG